MKAKDVKVGMEVRLIHLTFFHPRREEHDILKGPAKKLGGDRKFRVVIARSNGGVLLQLEGPEVMWAWALAENLEPGDFFLF